MSGIKLGTSISSLLVQRNLARVTSALQTGFEHLSSGLRINSAKDDAAGLALSEQLNCGARLYSQAVRNVNDGVSMLNIAEAALSEASGILTRQLELAEQAANGTLSLSQRRALDEEADALTDEFNRIVQNSEFNGRALLDLSFGSLKIQAGSDETSSVAVALGAGLARTVGDGTFRVATSLATITSTNVRDVFAEDFNGDGDVDILATNRFDSTFAMLAGNGNGTFEAAVTYTAGLGPHGTRLADLDGDGDLDIITNVSTEINLGILLSNGDGTFRAPAKYGPAYGGYDVEVGDLNGDSVLDLVNVTRTGGVVLTFLGNGNGTFKAGTSTAHPLGTIHSMELADLDGDTRPDLIVADNANNCLEILWGDGNGGFGSTTSITAGAGVNGVKSDDVNDDGTLDLVVANKGSGTMGIILGRGDGSFEEMVEYAATSDGFSVDIADFTGDGHVDVMFSGYEAGDMVFLEGDGTGGFRKVSAINVGIEPVFSANADFNGDGAQDSVVSDWGGAGVYLLFGNGKETSATKHLNLNTQEGALEAIDYLSAALDRVALELGSLGAMQSRFSHSINNLQQMRESYQTAASQITDVDVAAEAARLVRNRILQQAAAAVLVQANQQPAIALRMLVDSVES